MGTGIGLSLVKRIMERLGGTIRIESEVGQGTTVHLYFPIVETFPEQMLIDWSLILNTETCQTIFQ